MRGLAADGMGAVSGCAVLVRCYAADYRCGLRLVAPPALLPADPCCYYAADKEMASEREREKRLVSLNLNSYSSVQ